MKVKLIQITQNPIDVMWTAARTCYASESPIEMWDKSYQTHLDPDKVLTDACKKQEETHWKLVQQVLNSGHQSIAEHVYFTFAVEGISRACSHQLVRHRAGIVFSQQSQRYVEIKEDANKLNELLVNYRRYNDFTNQYSLREIVEKYFAVVKDTDYTFHGTETNDGIAFLADALLSYLIFIERGVKPEDARQFLPNATKTNITMSCNYRELIHMCNLRLCTRAQLEIRNLFKAIVEEVKKSDKRLAKYLVPQCKVTGFCGEHNCCARKPKLKTLQNTYKLLKEQFNSEEEFNKLINSIDDRVISDKLSLIWK